MGIRFRQLRQGKAQNWHEISITARIGALFLFMLFTISTVVPSISVYALQNTNDISSELMKTTAIPLKAVKASQKAAVDEGRHTLAGGRASVTPTQETSGEQTVARKSAASSITPHELTGLRTALSDTTVNADGSYTRRQYTSSKYYKSGNDWKPIDTTIIEDKNAADSTNIFGKVLGQVESLVRSETTFTIKANDWSVRFAPTNGNVAMVRVQGVNDGISFSPVASKTVVPVIINNSDGSQSVWYYSLWNGVDIEYRVTSDSLKENIFLKNRSSTNTMQFSISGAKLEKTSGDQKSNYSYRVVGALGNNFSIGNFIISLNKYGLEANQPITQRLDGSVLTLAVDTSYLKNLPADAFPVAIDPSVTRSNFGTRAGGDYLSYKSDGYTCNSSTCNPMAGAVKDTSGNWRNWRGAFKSPYDFLQGKKLINANLHMTQRLGLSVSGSTISRYFWAAHLTCFSYNCIGQEVGPAYVNSSGDMDVTSIYQTRIDNGDWGAWLVLLGEEIADTTYKNWDPDNTYVSFTYANYTPVPSITSPASNQTYVDPQVSFTSTTPSNPNSGTPLRYTFCISTSAGCGNVVANSGEINANQWTVPDGILQDGTTYYAQVRATDPDGGGGVGNYSSAIPFKIDMRRGKDKTQTYDSVGPVDIDLATGNVSTSVSTHTTTALAGDIGLSLDYNSPLRSRNGLVAQYWDNANRSGSPTMTRVDRNLDFSWGLGTYSANRANDNFSAQWTGYFVAPTTGTYYFGANNDDNFNLYLNNNTDAYYTNSYCPGLCYASSGVNLTAGQIMPIRVDYTEIGGGATARLFVKGAVAEQVVPTEWLQTGPRSLKQTNGLYGRYYAYNSDRNLDATTNTQFLGRTDSALNMTWSNAPVVGGSADFMVRWTGYITIPTSGTYNLGTWADDGSRIKIDGSTVMDNWTGSCCTLVYGTGTYLSAGTHSITVDMYDSGGPGAMYLYIKGAVAEQIVPSSWLMPSAPVLPDGWSLGIDPDGDLGYDRLVANANSVTLLDSTGSTHEYTWTGSAYKPPVNEDGNLTRNSDGSFTFLDSDGMTYTFDSSGVLTSVTSPVDDRKPAALTYSYSGSPAKIREIKDGVDPTRKATVYYGGDANCPTIPAGYSTTPSGMLCAMTTNDGRTTSFYYLDGNLAAMVAPGNETTTFQYDSLGRIVAIRSSSANDAINAGVRSADTTTTTQLIYDNLGRASSVTAPAATQGAVRQQQTFEYLPGDGTYMGATQEHITGDVEPKGYTQRVEYDNLFRTTKSYDKAGLTTAQEWNTAKDLLYSTTDATGLKSTTLYNANDMPTDSYGPAPSAWFDSTTRIPLATYTLRVPHTSTAYDSGMKGFAVTWFNYKSSTGAFIGSPKLHTTGFSSPADPSYSNPGYIRHDYRGYTLPMTADISGTTGVDGYGFSAVGKITFPASGTYTFKSWSDDSVRLYIDDVQMFNNWGTKTEGITQNVLSNVFVATAGKSYRVKLDYGHEGTLGVMDVWLSGPSIADASGQGLGTRDWSPYLIPDYGLQTSQTVYNTPTSNGSTVNLTSTTNYGTSPELGLATSATTDSTGLALTAASTYEQQGATGSYLRQTSSSLPGGATTNYAYYGATETRDNPCTDSAEAYRQGGMLKLKTEPDPDGAGAQTGRTTETIYDDTGKAVATRYNSDPWSCTAYDARERVTQTTVPAYNGQSARTVTNLYAVNGNPLITSSTDESGTILVETDLLGRNVRYIDAKGNITTSEYDSKGRLVKRTSGLGVETYTYDNVNRLTDQKLDGITLASASYNAYSQLTSVQYQTGLRLDLTRESTTTGLGRLIKRTYTTGTGQTLSDEVVRATTGDVTSGTELGQTKSYSYDTAGRLTAATLAGNSFTYGYGTQDSSCSALTGANANASKDSNRTSQTVNGVTTTYCYDQADRLIGSSNSLYDAAVYDSHGNTASLGSGDTKTYFTYDSSDRNTGITETNTTGSITTTYARDVQGRLTYRHHDANGSNATDDYYAYTSSGDSPDFITDLNGNVTEKYFTLPGDVLLTVRPQRTSAGVQTLSLPNIHGDIFATIDADGAVTGTAQTGPFGEALPNQTDLWNTLSAATLGYVGSAQKATEAQMQVRPIQMGARVYIPSTGRFLQVDPVQGGTPNNYVYPSDPVNEFDLDGAKTQRGIQSKQPKRLSQAEQKALQKKQANKPLSKQEKKLAKQAENKEKTNEKLKGERRNRNNKNGRPPSAPSGGVPVPPLYSLKPPSQRQIDVEMKAGSVIVAGAAAVFTVWWTAKAFAPACGPGALVCAVVL